MKRIICQKCGQTVSNDFGVTLSFCTNCGAALQNFNSAETLELGKIKIETDKPKTRLRTGLFAVGVLLLLIFGGVFLTYKYFLHKETADANGKSSSTPFIKMPEFNSVSASEITEISFYSWGHKGLLYSGDGFVEAKNITFRRGGTASQSEQKNYDDGDEKDQLIEKKAAITSEQFDRLAESIVKNDFFNQTDSTERISEGDSSLTVKFSGKEKVIKTSNIYKDTPQIREILNDLETLKLKLDWSPAK